MDKVEDSRSKSYRKSSYSLSWNMDRVTSEIENSGFLSPLCYVYLFRFFLGRMAPDKLGLLAPHSVGLIP